MGEVSDERVSMKVKWLMHQTRILFMSVLILLLTTSSAFAFLKHDQGTNNENLGEGWASYAIGTDPIVYVDVNTGADSNDGTMDHPKKTIQAGIDFASNLYSTSSVYVAEGSYTLSGSTITLHEGISLFGGYSQGWTQRDPSSHESIVTDERTSGGVSNSPNHVIFAGEDITSDTVIDGFTLHAGGGSHSTCILSAGSPTISNNVLNGGSASVASYGIYIQSNASPVITNNVIHGGTSTDRAAAIYASDSNAAFITNNRITGGSTHEGTVHAIYGKHANLLIANNSIMGGHCVSDQCYSCGIREASASHSTIINNTIDGGTGYRAYGILTSDGSDPRIYNNTINGGHPPQTAMGIYIKNDDNPRIINNIIFTSGGKARFCIYENDPGDFPGHPDPDSNPGILRNNNLFHCPTGLLSWFDEGNISWHAVTDLNTPITTAEDGVGTMAEWDNISEDISANLDEDFRFTGDLEAYDFDRGGRNGAHSQFNWGFTTDKDSSARSPSDCSATTGWSMGAYEYDSGSPPPSGSDINQDSAIDSLDLQLCANVILGVEEDPVILQRADINFDGQINEMDIQIIREEVLGVR
jgi:parallel beta-helix repeat protein